MGTPIFRAGFCQGMDQDAIGRAVRAAGWEPAVIADPLGRL